jgi:AbrB family looped-hinge helix DNA binding protein
MDCLLHAAGRALVAPARRIVGRKGQVTVPAEFREHLGIRAGDAVEFTLEPGGIRLTPARSRVDESFQAVPSLARPLTWKAVEQIAHEEHTEKAAREGLPAE